jgi:hypothetical protein
MVIIEFFDWSDRNHAFHSFLGFWSLPEDDTTAKEVAVRYIEIYS